MMLNKYAFLPFLAACSVQLHAVAAISVFPNFSDDNEVALLLAAEMDFGQDDDSAEDIASEIFYGTTPAPPSFTRRVHEITGAVPSHDAMINGRALLTKWIGKTTSVHKDNYIDEQDRSCGVETKGGDVGFVFLNTNPDAEFVQGDTKVPVVAGSFVTFAGYVPHNTVVRSGSVQIAGPFIVKSMDGVGAAGGCGDQQTRCCYTVDDGDGGRDLSDGAGGRKRRALLERRELTRKTVPNECGKTTTSYGHGACDDASECRIANNCEDESEPPKSAKCERAVGCCFPTDWAGTVQCIDKICVYTQNT